MENTDDEAALLYKKQGKSGEEPLLKKYNLIIEQLDYKFIETCTNAEELEKIIHVLKSGEEGTYPDLLKRSKDRLAELDPKNKCLREPVVLLKKSELAEGHRASLVFDLEKYIQNATTDNEELSSLNDMCLKTNEPPVRQTKTLEAVQAMKQPAERLKSMDYESWNKFDADAKLLEMDLEEERMKQENEKKAQMRKKISTISVNKSVNTKAELTKAATEFNNAGRECFAAKDYETALYYYNNSISMKPTSNAYANRGLTYVKLEKYSNAMDDLTKALEMDSNNTTAFYGKALALKGLKKYAEAMKYLDNLIKVDPNYHDYQTLAQELRTLLGNNTENNRRSVRLQIQ